MDLKMLKVTPPWEWPRDAGKTFLGILRNHRANPSDRLIAADLAGECTVINKELADALLSIVRSSDEPERLRTTAAISLGPVLEDADVMGFEDPDDVPISEETYHKIQRSLHNLYMNDAVPKEVRRRILEASVRGSQDWHKDAIRKAYSSDDRDWKLTAVFSMSYVSGFNDQILESLDSADSDIHYEAIRAAGNWEVDEAWPQIAALVTSGDASKPLLLAAIDAVASIRPKEARSILADLADSDDEEIAEAAYEAITMAEAASGEEYEDDEYEDEDLLPS